MLYRGCLCLCFVVKCAELIPTKIKISFVTRIVILFFFDIFTSPIVLCVVMMFLQFSLLAVTLQPHFNRRRTLSEKRSQFFSEYFGAAFLSLCLAGYENVHEASHLAFRDKIRGKMFVLCMQNLSAVPEKPLMPDLHLRAQRKMPVKS